MLSAIIDSMHDGLTVIDETGQVLRRNPAGAEMVRTEPDRLNNLRDSRFTIMTTDGREMRHAGLPVGARDRGRERRQPGHRPRLRRRLAEPHAGASARAGCRRRDARGMRQAVVIYHDVTTDRAQRTALESFAGVVAHDLRGPSQRHRRLGRAARPRPGDAGLAGPGRGARPKLDRIRSAAHGMHRLIDDLLDSSISREQQLRSGVVDLGGRGSLGGRAAHLGRRPVPHRASRSPTCPTRTPTPHSCVSCSTT